MIRHEWRVVPLGGAQSVRLSGQGIWLGDEIKPWSALSDVAFVRYQGRYGKNEEFWLWFGPQDRRRLNWSGNTRQRADWRAMLVDFAGHAARHRPDMTVRDGPDADERRFASRVGLGVAVLALTIMTIILTSGPTLAGTLVAGWVGIMGAGIGAVIWRFYARTGDPPRLDWSTFAAREGQSGDLPAN